MSRKANPTVVGAFVVAGTVLGVLGVFLLGAKTVFHTTHAFILYFHGDVNGLSVGAPVKFQGVPIGEVTAIKLRITPEGAAAIIPVKILLDEDIIERAADYDVSLTEERYQRAIDDGLRGRLDTESLVTGQRYVALLMDKESPKELLGLTPGIDEIPTVPTTTEELMKIFDQLKSLKLRETFEDLADTVKSLKELAASPALKTVPGSLQKALDSLQQTLATIQGSFRNADGAIAALQSAVTQTDRLQQELENTLRTARELLDPQAPLVVQLQTTLQEIGDAARSLRTLSDSVEREPAALLRGRDVKEKP